MGVTGFPDVLLGLPLLAAVVVVAGRVGATARFVTWPIVVLTVLAAAVALVGVWVGLDRPGLLAAGVLPGLMVSYVLPAAPVTVVAGVLAGLAGLAVGVRVRANYYGAVTPVPSEQPWSCSCRCS